MKNAKDEFEKDLFGIKIRKSDLLTPLEGITILVGACIGVALGLLLFITVHEGGHFLVASLINPNAINGTYFPIENIPKALFAQEQKNIPECDSSAACVTYKSNLRDSFGPVGGLLVAFAGVAASTVLLFLSLRLKRAIEKRFVRKNIFDVAAVTFLIGWLLAGFVISLGWTNDCLKAVLIFINNTITAKLIFIPFFLIPALILGFICVFAILDLVILPIPLVKPLREELKAVVVKYKVGFVIR
jgi:hypothetical protein